MVGLIWTRKWTPCNGSSFGGIERTHIVALSYGGYVGLKMMTSGVVDP